MIKLAFVLQLPNVVMVPGKELILGTFLRRRNKPPSLCSGVLKQIAISPYKCMACINSVDDAAILCKNLANFTNPEVTRIECGIFAST